MMKVGRMLKGWKVRLLLQGGHLVLLWFVFPMFYLSIFKLPMSVGKQLEGLMRRFFRKAWGR